MIIHRKLADIIGKYKKSLLLLGPRQTGKSTLIESFAPDLTINLAHETTFLNFASDSSLLETQLKKTRPKTIFVDEIQRLPSLLNTIQVLLDSKAGYRFYLSGSSARKLKRGKANLLPGRILSFELGPLIATELREKFNLADALSVGTLPGIYLEENSLEREKILLSYAATYLKEEIQAEALTKDLQGFARFLRFCAANAGQYLDLTKLSKEAQVKRSSAIRFFEILEDTMIVYRSDAFARSEKRRLVQHPRFFFFDNGVLNGTLGNFTVSEDRKGNLFEHFVWTQLFHAARAYDKQVRISNYRTEHQAEVDIILEFSNGPVWAIECKSGKTIGKEDLGGFRSFEAYYKKPHRKMVIYAGSTPREIRGVQICPLEQSLGVLFGESEHGIAETNSSS